MNTFSNVFSAPLVSLEITLKKIMGVRVLIMGVASIDNVNLSYIISDTFSGYWECASSSLCSNHVILFVLLITQHMNHVVHVLP